MDVTKHDESQGKHAVNKQSSDPFIRHTPQWWAEFGNRCPICGVEAQFAEPKESKRARA